MRCNIVRGCLWDEEDYFVNIPEILEFENDMFGGDFNEKIKDMEKVYAGMPDGKISDEVNKIFLDSLKYILFCLRLCLALQWPEQ